MNPPLPQAVSSLIVLVLSLSLFLVFLNGYNRQKNHVWVGAPKAHPTVLAIDLDETLVRSAITPNEQVNVLFRPHVAFFLSSVASMYDQIAVFTAGTESYARPIIDALAANSGIVIMHQNRLYRDSCTPIKDEKGNIIAYCKDLRRLGHPISRVTLLDNMPISYSLQPDRGVPIPSFFGDPEDRALLDVLNILKKTLAVSQ